ncbi:cobyrinate a,c-diamide synthase [Leptospira langatensis]|uniref:Cobyrinate a,c-diamide synthase n=1 Tax=Leptospira langatensis TaxID=2484983 RepID=A0A5F1ZWV9_9LEPT|nr:cobyrinate a,c-diamide synthase [Leptospira langatensis]TGJ98427.1 cobyrinate a,c-diamide synthase [Leptospira langatensis]TGL43342.1 cobyrinate a,c-diamide synthase [Leptospira langatensis]
MLHELNIPRILISGTGSGTGKTTLVVGLTKAFQARGIKVSAFKCGPDYLDPTYHSHTTGKSCQNLDGWLMGKESVLSSFIEASRDSDLTIIEGVMGLFDGHSPHSDIGSTAEIAKWLQAPVIALIDASGMARTFAAISSGLLNYDPEVPIQGFIANFVGSEGHTSVLKSAMEPFPLLGGIPKFPEQSFPERHLGLHSATAKILSNESLSFWKNICESYLDLDEILSIARKAPILSFQKEEGRVTKQSVCRIGVAKDNAFHFYYEENLRRLQESGAELVYFSPINDKFLPEVDGLYLGGGYPELHAPALSQNTNLLKDIRDLAGSGAPIYAECGGLMYLSEEIQDLQGVSHPMLGLIPGKTIMGPKLKALGYVEVHTEKGTILGEAGTRFRGHQFRYSDLVLEEEREELYSYKIRKRKSDLSTPEGYTNGNILGSYVHAHWASNPSIPENFVNACMRSKN